jgi:hypothetical protein
VAECRRDSADADGTRQAWNLCPESRSSAVALSGSHTRFFDTTAMVEHEMRRERVAKAQSPAICSLASRQLSLNRAGGGVRSLPTLPIDHTLDRIP